MAERDKSKREPEGPSDSAMYDYDFLDKPLIGYPPGTMFDLGDGKPIDVTKVPDPFARRGSK